MPTSGELVDVPKESRVAVVGGGYAALAAAFELRTAGRWGAFTQG